MSTNNPNILLVVLDAVRADHTTLYGYERPTTPNLQKLSQEGVLFGNAFAPSNWTPTSHGAIFTGQLPSHSGVTRSSRVLPEDTRTLSEHIKAEGYRTFSTSAGAQLRADRGFARGFDVYKETYRIQLDSTSIMKMVAEPSFRNQTYFSLTRGPDTKTLYKFDALKRWIENGSDDPYFAFLNCKVAHNPYNPPRPYKSLFCAGLSRPRFEFLERLYSAVGLPTQTVEGMDDTRLEKMATTFPLIGGEFVPTDEEWDIIKAWYDGAIRYMDWKIGEIVEFLRSKDDYDDTFIVVTSDHGELFGEHGLEKHTYSLYEPLLRVPLVIKPATTAGSLSSSRVDSMVSLLDLFPTLIETAGGIPPARPFAETLYDMDKRERHTHVFAELDSMRNTAPKRRYPDLDDSAIGRPVQSVRDHKYKLIRTSDGDIELYDWKVDSEESNDLSEKMAGKVVELESILEKQTGELQGRDEAEREPDDERLHRQLEALGYL